MMTTRHLCTLLVWLCSLHVTSCASIVVRMRDEAEKSQIPQIFHAGELGSASRDSASRNKGDEDYTAHARGYENLEYLIGRREVSGQEEGPLEKGLWGKRDVNQIFPPSPISIGKPYREKKLPFQERKRNILQRLRQLEDENDDYHGLDTVGIRGDAFVPIEKGLWGKRDNIRLDDSSMFYVDNDNERNDMSDESTESPTRSEDQAPKTESEGAYSVLEKGLWGKRDNQEEREDIEHLHKRGSMSEDGRSGYDIMRRDLDRIERVKKKFSFHM